MKRLLLIVEPLKAKFDFKISFKRPNSFLNLVKHFDQMLSYQEKFWRVIQMVVTRQRLSRLMMKITSSNALYKVLKLDFTNKGENAFIRSFANQG